MRLTGPHGGEPNLTPLEMYPLKTQPLAMLASLGGALLHLVSFFQTSKGYVMNTQTFYAPLVTSLALNVAVDGSHRGNRHGVFTDFVEHAGRVLAGLPEGTYTTRAIATMAGTPGWAARVAAYKLKAATGNDDASIEVHPGGRGHATIVQIRF